MINKYIKDLSTYTIIDTSVLGNSICDVLRKYPDYASHDEIVLKKGQAELEISYPAGFGQIEEFKIGDRYVKHVAYEDLVEPLQKKLAGFPSCFAYIGYGKIVFFPVPDKDYDCKLTFARKKR